MAKLPKRFRLPKLKPPKPRNGPSLRDELWNLPNILTYGRVLLIPVVMYYLGKCTTGADPTSVDRDSRLYSFIATCLFSLAAITDFLDGWIARNWNLGTMLGRFLDPLADKLIVTACLVMLVELGRTPAWLVILLLARELSVTSLRSMASSEGLEVAVSQGGKWKTAFQLIGLVGLLTHYSYPVVFWGLGTWACDFNLVGNLLLGGSMIFSISSAIEYFYRFAVAAASHDHAHR